jgi:hypothetical protein
MPGELDRDYVLARRVLLDALEALAEHRNAVTLVGAQAIYLHTGEGDLAVAHYTTDGDLALNPQTLAELPLIEQLLSKAGFARKVQTNQAGAPNVQVGIWVGDHDITVDLLVPEAVGGEGRRGARLGPHGNDVARKARGLEAVLIDNEEMLLTSLEPSDTRSILVRVAGPSALLVAKLHKIADMLHSRRSALENKDALDVYRLLQDVSTEALVDGFRRLLNTTETDIDVVTREALSQLAELFGESGSTGSQMAVDAAGILADPATIAATCAALTQDLLQALQPPADMT